MNRDRSGTRVTIRDVAKAANVSIATVSNVLTRKPSVSTELAHRVNEAVLRLGYRSDGIASSLRRLQSQVVGLVIPDFSNPFFGELIAAFETKTKAAGFRLLVASSREDDATERNEIDALLNWRIAGLAVVPANDTFSALALLQQANVPTVVIDRVKSGLPFDSVGVENRFSASLAVEHLSALGHRKILIVASDLLIANVRERVEGVHDAAVKTSLVVEVVECGNDIPIIYRKLRNRLSGSNRPTALFALTNLTALGALKVLADLDISVPSNISVIGFDDYDWMQLMRPAISTIRQPTRKMAEEAFDILTQRISSHAEPIREVQLDCSLIIRHSTAPPRK